MTNPEGVVSKSTPVASCAVDGCDQARVPDSLWCGDCEHAQLGEPGTKSADGTVVGVADSLNTVIGGQDGTARGKKWKPRKRSSQSALRSALGHHELRVDIGAEPGRAIVSGRAIVYQPASATIRDQFGMFRESIRPGAAGHLLGGDIQLLYNHDGLALARTTAKTLILEQDDRGVCFAASVDIETSPHAQSVVSSIKSGSLSSCSFAFTVNEAGESWTEGMTKREIIKFASIPEISVVNFPAYKTGTSAAARSRAFEHQRARVLAQQAKRARIRQQMETR